MSISISELLYQNLCRSNAICMYLDHVLGTILPDILKYCTPYWIFLKGQMVFVSMCSLSSMQDVGIRTDDAQFAYTIEL